MASRKTARRRGILFLLSLFILICHSHAEEEKEDSNDDDNDNYQIGRVLRQIHRLPQRSFQPIVLRPTHRFTSSYYHRRPSYKTNSSIRQQRPFTVSIASGGRVKLGANYGPVGGLGGRGCHSCVHLVECPGISHNQGLQGCGMMNGATGVCCPTQLNQPPWGGITRLFQTPTSNIPMRDFSSNELNQACEKGARSVRSIRAVEGRLMRSNQVLRKGTPARQHLKFFQITRSARGMHAGALAISKASEAMKRDFRLTKEQGCIGLKQFSARQTILSKNCPSAPSCPPPHSKYRTLDGSCNNLRHSIWGKSETAFQRILPAQYEDGIRTPRTRSVTGSFLPNERAISRHVLIDIDQPDPEFTLSLMQWGQFVDHDMTHSPFSSFENEEGKECCRDGQFLPSQLLEDCWPINIPNNDEFYSRRGQKCMNFVRTMLAEDEECNFGCAEQMNQITHWLDGSNIYGSSQQEAAKIRDFNTGLLYMSQNNLLPYEREKSHDCEAARGTCYAAGDSRVNEQPGLIAIHTIWHREHNRVARALGSINPQWSPENVFQEARRIVIAEYQHIIYNEWLPIIVGKPFMNSFDISPKSGRRNGGYSLDYHSTINPNMNNEFATAAFRFGHTLVQGTMSIFSNLGRQGNLRLKDHFNSPHLFQQDPSMLDKFARTFTQQSIQRFDSFITKALTNHLFETSESDFGMDLMSINIHRGRDHGLANYNDMRVVCGLPRAHQFGDLTDQIPPPTVKRLSHLYKNVNDIDFFVGGISETPRAGGLLGWTFLCVVGDQFARVKKGDRFFYDLGGQPSSFSPNQLNELRMSSWARILCDNTKMGHVQPLAFRLPRGLNQQVPCNSPSIPPVNLFHWRGERLRG